MDSNIDYDYNKNTFYTIKKEEKSVLLQNILSGMVDMECEQDSLIFFDKFNISRDNTSNYKNNDHLPTIIKQLYINNFKNFANYGNNTELESINIENYSNLKVNYSCVISINFILFSLISKIIDEKEKEYEKKLKQIFDRNFNMNVFKKSQKLKEFIKILEEFETIKTVEICLYDKKYESIINIEYIYLFCIFFEFLFPNILDLVFNFNSEKITKYFLLDKNPYRIIQRMIRKVARKYDKILISLFMISCVSSKIEKIQNLKFTMMDSYIIELNEIITQNYKLVKNELNLNNNRNNLTFLSILNNFDNLFSLDCEFNSLDPIIFEKLNYLLIKNISIESLRLNLFPYEIKSSNFRKILQNQIFYKGMNKIVDPYDLIYDIDEVTNLTCEPEKLNIISDDKILMYLFDYLKENLKKLLVIIESKIKKLKYFKIMINTNNFNELTDYDPFNCIFAVFIYNLLLILNANKLQVDMIEFEINAGGFKFDYNSLRKGITRSTDVSNPTDTFNLEVINISNFKLNLQIGNLFMFDQLPLHNLMFLEIKNISIDDLQNFTNFLKKRLEIQKENILINMHYINIQIAFTFLKSKSHEKFFTKVIKNFFLVKKTYNLEKINFFVKNKLKEKYIFKIIESISKNKFKSKLKEINLHFMLDKINIFCKNLQYFIINKFLTVNQIIINRLRINTFFLNKIFHLLFALKHSIICKKFEQNNRIYITVCKFLYTKRDLKITLV